MLPAGFTASLHANPVPETASIAILQRLKKLNVLTRVLYIAAHPDDENNFLNAFLTKELMADVAYLSLTRGEGGLNRIGSEQQEALAILRTQESEASHRLDGARTFFTRAADFGFSKKARETLQVWNNEEVLADIVWIIRQYRPDIIITRFNEDVPESHGHHIASAILAREAFTAAADPRRFPGQLKYTTIWQPKRLLWNVYGAFTVKGPGQDQINNDGYVVIDAGKYNPLLGASYGEIAAQSRMLHKSQGMGMEPQRGQHFEYFKHIAGDSASRDIFDGVDQSWSRTGHENISDAIRQIVAKFNIYNPPAVLPDLVALLKALDGMQPDTWLLQKKKELLYIIHDILGLHLEATTDAPLYSPGEKTVVHTRIVNRSETAIALKKISFEFAGKDTLLNISLQTCKHLQVETNLALQSDIAYSQPYWLSDALPRNKTMGDHYAVLCGLADEPGVNVVFYFSLYDYPVSFSEPVQYRYISPESGEQQKNIVIAPPVMVNIAQPVYAFTSLQPKKITVGITAGADHISGAVQLKAPPGYRVSPQQQPFSINKKSGSLTVDFLLTPSGAQQVGMLEAEAVVNGIHYNRECRYISYPHIREQYYFPPARSKVSKIDMVKSARKIANLKGAADLIEESLKEAGYDVTDIDVKDINPHSLSRFDAVIIGIRAYNVLPGLDQYKKVLKEYIKEGGNVIALYNTSFDLLTPDVGLFPLELSADRITDENAEVKFLHPAHGVLNYPNKITPADFTGWVIERGAYFPKSWSDQYEALLSFSDPGEAPLNGSLLIAKYGKGYFTYTSLSFFRQLPAGVPGAYRLFSNMLSLSKYRDQ
ncbi:MAG: PIG-L family deacetylase [Agriterribacter sp.]